MLTLNQFFIAKCSSTAHSSCTFRAILFLTLLADPSCLLPQNCISRQEETSWGYFYSTDILKIPAYMTEPVHTLKNLLQKINKPYFKAQNLQLEEETDTYLHYTYRVIIPSGPLKGAYIDDLEIYYDGDRRIFQTCSLSRNDFKNITHVHKNRLEALKSEWYSHLMVILEEFFKEEKMG